MSCPGITCIYDTATADDCMLATHMCTWLCILTALTVEECIANRDIVTQDLAIRLVLC